MLAADKLIGLIFFHLDRVFHFIIIITQFWSGFISPTPTLHLAWFKASSICKPTLLLSFSTCVFHIFFGRPHFLLPFTSNSSAFLKTCPSSLLNTCPCHLTPFAFAIWTTVSFNLNISFRPCVLFFPGHHFKLHKINCIGPCISFTCVWVILKCHFM